MKKLFLSLLFCFIAVLVTAQPNKSTVNQSGNIDSLLIKGKSFTDTLKIRIYFDQHDDNTGWRAYKDGYSIQRHLSGTIMWNLPEIIVDRKFVPIKLQDLENFEIKQFNWK